jgi:hypothetical protein
VLRDHLRVPEAALAARVFPTALPQAVSGPVLLAFNNCCDVIVATAVTGDEPVAQEQAVLEFVNCDLAAQGSSDIRALVQPPPVNGPEVGAELVLSNSPEGHSRSIRNAGESTAAFATALRAGLGHSRRFLRVHATSPYPPKLNMKADVASRQPWAKALNRCAIASGCLRARQLGWRSSRWLMPGRAPPSAHRPRSGRSPVSEPRPACRSLSFWRTSQPICARSTFECGLAAVICRASSACLWQISRHPRRW